MYSFITFIPPFSPSVKSVKHVCKAVGKRVLYKTYHHFKIKSGRKMRLAAASLQGCLSQLSTLCEISTWNRMWKRERKLNTNEGRMRKDETRGMERERKGEETNWKEIWRRIGSSSAAHFPSRWISSPTKTDGSRWKRINHYWNQTKRNPLETGEYWSDDAIVIWVRFPDQYRTVLIFSNVKIIV